VIVPLNAVVDALAKVFGPEVMLAIILFFAVESVQVRYLKSEIKDVDEGVQDIRKRVKRVESIHMKSDGGVEED